MMKYAGSEASDGPTLRFIENSIRPNADTMGKSPNDLRQTGKSYLRLRGYGLVFALHHFAKGKYLDPETFTWFPEDRLSGGDVACGYWYPDSPQGQVQLERPGLSELAIAGLVWQCLFPSKLEPCSLHSAQSLSLRRFSYIFFPRLSNWFRRKA